MSIESGIANSPEQEPKITEIYGEEKYELKDSVPVELKWNEFMVLKGTNTIS